MTSEEKKDIESQLPLPSKAWTLLLILSSITTSVLLILSNKYLLSKYHFSNILFLSSTHFLCTALFTRILRMRGVFSGGEMPFEERVRMSLCGVGSIVFMNWNLLENSVGLYQCSKLLCIPYMVLYSRILQGQKVTVETLVSLLLILVGVGKVTISDISVTFNGLLIALLAVISTAQFQIWQGSKQRQYNLNALQMTDLMMPLQFLFCSFIMMMSEIRAPTLLQFDYSLGFWQVLLLGCLLAVAVNLVTYALIGKTSAVTYQVVGHLKTILTIMGGVLLFEDGFKEQFAGILLAMVGMLMYGDVKSQNKGETILCRTFGKEFWLKEI